MKEPNEGKSNLSNESYNLSNQERFFYSITQLANTILAGIFELTYVNFFWDDLKLQQFYFSIGLIIYAIVNSLNDFYLGRVSDKTNVEKWGSRRLVYIKFGGILWAFILFSMWFPWSYTNQIIIFIHFVVAICAFDMLLSLVWLVWLALLPELTENFDERNKVSLYVQFMGIIGAFPVLIAFFVYETSLFFFQIFAGICALFCAICYFTVGTKLRERPELYVQQEIIPLGRSIKEVLKSRSFVTITIFRCVNHMIISLSLGFVFAYFFVLDVDLLTASLLFYLNFTIIAFIGYIIYKKLSMKYDMRTLVIRGRTLQIILNVIGFFIIVLTGINLIIWIFIFLSSICGGYILFDYPLLMLITDDDEVTHGTRREGLIMGANAFFIKIAQSLGPILGTFVLLSFGFVRDAPSQTYQAEFGILFLYFIVISILSFIGLLGIIFFPLHGENLRSLKEQIKKIHNKKAESYKIS